MTILEGADVRLNYEVIGEGTPVTLLHGFTQSARSWHETIERLPEGWKWVLPDLRGHGDTEARPGAPYTMDACTADLEMLWDHLGIARTHLVGYSMGGRLAIHIAARRPERLLSLLTIGAHAGLEEDAREGRRRGDEALAQRIETDGLDAFVDYWGGLPLFAGLERRGPSFVAQVRAERMKNRVAGLAGALRGMGAGAMRPVWDELAHVQVPCTFVAGQLDHGYVASARRLATSIPHGRMVVVQRAGHSVHQERPDAFARLLLAHLEAAADKSEAPPSSSTSA
ncbi:MAG: 2-succinyl-6-hydroxy-2,4-cyclohexadiene-1-carboxylate synthase [Candidatus Dormibacteraeota bacterium]|nr:2-succinyl-6-hydroxy-2,4-cyclohexadiene-1-carboxylate synthase [Candidatus Dormibacteraeota bacterium]